jgi:hypothetical protein
MGFTRVFKIFSIREIVPRVFNYRHPCMVKTGLGKNRGWRGIILYADVFTHWDTVPKPLFT